MLYELIVRLVSLDTRWLAGFIFGNIFWIFAVIATEYYLTEGRKTISGFTVVSLMLLAVKDFLGVTKLVIFSAYGLLLLYLSRVVILILLERTAGLSKYTPLAWLMSFYIVMLLLNLSGAVK